MIGLCPLEFGLVRFNQLWTLWLQSRLWKTSREMPDVFESW